MELNAENALRAYAQMLNTLNADYLEPLLAEDFHYESQSVFGEIESKLAFMKYIRGKLLTISKSESAVFAEMAHINAYGKTQPCVVVAQNSKDNLVGLVLAEVLGGKLTRLDMCIAPSPSEAQRTGEYPRS